MLRLSGIYGPERASLIDKVRAGEAAPAPGDETNWTNRIHRDDAAGALRHLLRLERPQSLYIGSDHEPATRADVRPGWPSGSAGRCGRRRIRWRFPNTGAGAATDAAGTPGSCRAAMHSSIRRSARGTAR